MSSTDRDGADRPRGVNIVLVHGAWLGAWAWKRVLAPLRAAGHRVFPVTLSGVGERAHQPHEGIRLQTHVDDVKAVIECEELSDVLLVGHSYSGMAITGVADQLPTRIARLVYLDAVVPEPGESWSSRHTPETQAQRRELIAKFGHLPVTEPHGMGLKPEDGGSHPDPAAFVVAQRHVGSTPGRRRGPTSNPLRTLVGLGRVRIPGRSAPCRMIESCTQPAHRSQHGPKKQ